MEYAVVILFVLASFMVALGHVIACSLHYRWLKNHQDFWQFTAGALIIAAGVTLLLTFGELQS